MNHTALSTRANRLRRHGVSLLGLCLGLGLSLSQGLAFAAEQAAAKAPAAQPLSSGNLLQVVLGMALVLGLLIGGAWLMRRMGVGYSAAAGNMRVVGGLSLGARERMVVVEVGDTQLLVGITPGSIQTLHVLDKPLVNEKHAAASGSFAERLADVLKRGSRT